MTEYTITLTDKAVEIAKSELTRRDIPNGYMRLGLKGSGGCNGYEYVIRYEDDKPRDKDLQFNFDGLKVLIDNKSITYLNGTTLDYEKTLLKQGYVFKSPNVISSCGCGKSVSFK